MAFTLSVSCLLISFSLCSKLDLETPCTYRFLKYRPSPFEEVWHENIRKWEKYLTTVVTFEPQETRFRTWMESLDRYRVTKNDKDLPRQIFSEFVYEKQCGGKRTIEIVKIEPIAGLTRHPYFLLEGSYFIVNKDYMLVNNTFAHNPVRKDLSVRQPDHTQKHQSLLRRPDVSPERKYYYFDFGASLYNEGFGGASQSWFVEQYEADGIFFDGIFAFEGEYYYPEEVFYDMPPHLLPRYHWYNVFVSDRPSDPFYAVRFITSVAKASDFVLVKLDIDNNEIEEGIINAILDDPVASQLIDELFWEHHVNVPEMYNSWNTQTMKRYLHDTYDIFAKMRKKGIRAHSWV